MQIQWYLAFLALGAGLGVAIAAVGSALGLAKTAAAALEGTARQPEAAGDLRTTMIIGGALIEALTLYALVIGIMLWLKIPDADKLTEIFK